MTLEKKLMRFGDGAIVRYSIGHDVPIVGLVRDQDTYREALEISILYGFALGMRRQPPAPDTGDVAAPAEAPGETGPKTLEQEPGRVRTLRSE